MQKHIEYLLEVEKSSCQQYGGRIRFNRTGQDTIVVSCEGYNHMDLMEVEEKLLKLGCRYDHSKHLQCFDKMSGRTYTHFREPKALAS